MNTTKETPETVKSQSTSFLLRGGVVFDVEPILAIFQSHSSPEEFAAELDESMAKFFEYWSSSISGGQPGINACNTYHSLRLLRSAILKGTGAKTSLMEVYESFK